MEEVVSDAVEMDVTAPESNNTVMVIIGAVIIAYVLGYIG